MNFSFICFLVVCTAAGALAQEGVLCKADNRMHAVGDIIFSPLGHCQDFICGPDAEIVIRTCEVPVPRPGDTTKQYPDCCDRYVC